MEHATKVAVLVLEDLETWQKLNVAAFLATGIAGAAPEALGGRYEDGDGRAFAGLLAQPITILQARPDDLARAHRQGIARGLTRAAYVRAMFSAGENSVSREAFRAEPPDAPDLVGLALRGASKNVDKAVKGARLHP
jgi:hypothetical protein